MSTELGHIGSVQLTRFWGGLERGVCLQLTEGRHYVQLNAQECAQLVEHILMDDKLNASAQSWNVPVQILVEPLPPGWDSVAPEKKQRLFDKVKEVLCEHKAGGR